MSILRSLQVGVSGLRSHSEALGVNGDNIANVNTVGFKNSRAEFEDMIASNVSRHAPAQEMGGGSRIGEIRQIWSQGSLINTDRPTDLAISGEGMFVLEGTLRGSDSRWFTRAGQFLINDDGMLVNSDGLRVQGYNANTDGTLSSVVEDLVVASNSVAASPTTEVNVAANLNAEALDLGGFVPASPESTSNFSTEVTVYDSLGGEHQVVIFFNKSGAPNTWEWHAMVDGGELDPSVTVDANGNTPESGVLSEMAGGVLAFDTNGALTTEFDLDGTTTPPTPTTWTFLNATAQDMTFDFGASVTEGESGLDGTTQFSSVSTTTSISQNGFNSGTVAGLSIEPDGTINGLFSNGEQRPLGRIALAAFTNMDGLERVGAGMFGATEDAGEAMVGAANSGWRGSIISGSLEQSNVDLGAEFVNLISNQRGFQANSRVITTADDMYAELVNIKR